METDSPTLVEFFKFLDSRCEELELSKREPATGSNTTTHLEKPKRITQSMVAVESSGCTKCSSTEHTLYGCQQFLDMSGLQRRSFGKEKSLCYNCLRPGYGVNRCKSTYKCRQWKGNHHSLLHVQQNPQASGNIAQIAERDERNLSVTSANSVTLSHLLYVHKAHLKEFKRKRRPRNMTSSIGHRIRAVVCIWALHPSSRTDTVGITHFGYGNLFRKSRHDKGMQHAAN